MHLLFAVATAAGPAHSSSARHLPAPSAVSLSAGVGASAHAGERHNLAVEAQVGVELASEHVAVQFSPFGAYTLEGPMGGLRVAVLSRGTLGFGGSGEMVLGFRLDRAKVTSLSPAVRTGLRVRLDLGPVTFELDPGLRLMMVFDTDYFRPQLQPGVRALATFRLPVTRRAP